MEKLLGVKFECLTDLACHLLEKMYVDNRSVAAFTLLSSGPRAGMASVRNSLGSPGQGDVKHRDTQLQLQRKLQERQEQEQQEQENGRQEQKRKLGEQEQGFLVTPQHGAMKRSKVGEEQYPGQEQEYLGQELGLEQQQAQQRYSVVVPNSQADHYVLNGNSQQGNFEPQDFRSYGSQERLELPASSLALIQPSSISLHPSR